MARRTFRVVVSFLLMAGLLAVFLWNVDLAEVARSVEGAHLSLLGGATSLALLSYWVRAARWGLILRPVARVRHGSLLLTTAVGYSASTLLPARMGDILRPVLLARREQFSVSASLASILIERVFDLWVVIVFLLVFLARQPAMTLDADSTRALGAVGALGWAIGAGVLAGTIFLLILFRYQERAVKIVTLPIDRLLPRLRPAVEQFLHHFLDGLRVVHRPRDLAVTLGASVALWMVIYWQAQVALLAFGLELPFRAMFLLVALTVVGVAVPTPGGIGGFHAALQAGLTLFFGVDLATATAAAIVYHAICFVPITIIGLLCLPALGVTWRGATRVAKEARVDAGGTP